MVRYPDKTGAIAYDHSIPAALGDVARTTLVLVQQADTRDGELATAIRRFRIDPSACEWAPIR